MLEAGEGLLLRSTHASEASFLRDVAAALQAVLDASLQPPDKVTAALNKTTPASELPEEVGAIRTVLRRLLGDRLLQAIEADANTRSTASSDDVAEPGSRKVWLHSINLASIRSHAITRRPAAPDAASGGLVYNSQHNCLVESREGECPTLLTPWGIAMTNPGFIRPRVDSLDNAGAQRRSRPSDMAQAMEMAAKEAQEADEGKHRAGMPHDSPPIPPSLAHASRVIVQARVVIGTLEAAGGKLLAPGSGPDEPAASPLERPPGWRARQWKQSWGAASPTDGWGREGNSASGSTSEDGKEAGTDGGAWAALGPVWDHAARESLKAGAKDRAAVREGAVRARKAAEEAGTGLEAVEAAAARAGASACRDAAQVAWTRAAAQVAGASSAKMGAAAEESLKAAEAPALASELFGAPPVAKGGAADGEGGADPVGAGEAARIAEELSMQGVLAQYTHWHEATLELVLTRPAPSWSRFMVPAEASTGADDGELSEDDAGDGVPSAERAEALRRDLKRGVLSDAPGRSGAGPAGAPLGLEALLARLQWELRGLLGLGVRALTRLTGGLILRGPDMVPEPAKWRVVGIDEAVPLGWWEGDRRAAAAWQTAEALASSRLVSERGDWTEVAEALASMPRPDLARPDDSSDDQKAEEDEEDGEEARSAEGHRSASAEAAERAMLRWPAPPAVVAGPSPTGIPSDMLLVLRARAPLMRHWPAAALGTFCAAANVRAAVRKTAAWQFDEEEGAESAPQDGVDAEFGATWHDGWSGVEAPSSSMVSSLRTFGERVGMGDGRWGSYSTAMLDPLDLGRLEVASKAEPEQDDKEGTSDEAEAADGQIKHVNGLEHLQFMPPPPSWARSALKQMAEIASTTRA